MLPGWFAEYTLYLGVEGLGLSIAITAFGYLAAYRGHFTPLLSDMRRAHPAGVVTVAVGSIGGIAFGAWALTSADGHIRLAASSLAILALVVALLTAVMLPIRRIWTNACWSLPTATAMTTDQVRTIGRIYVLVGVALTIATIGALIGIVPKLVYVGEVPIPELFLGFDFVLLVVGGVIAFKAWKLYQSLRVNQTSRGGSGSVTDASAS